MSRRQSPARSGSQPVARPSAKTPPGAIQKAWESFTRGDRGQAETLCRSILKSQPEHAGALSLLGIVLAQARRTEEAAQLLGRAAARLPNDASAHNNYGNVLRDLGRHVSALGAYERALAIQPDYADAHYNRAVVLQDLGRFEEAIAGYERALAFKPGYAAAYNNRGAALQGLGRFADAVASYDQALALKPDYAAALNNRGAALHNLQRHEDALASYARALAVSPDYAEAHGNRGVTLNALERFEEALASFDRSLTLVPGYAEALNNRGVALHNLERHQDALASYAQALALSPDYAEAHSNRGVTLNALERLEEALMSYARAQQINPNHPDAARNQGATLHRLKRFDQALASHERALMLRRDAETYRNHAATLFELRRPEEAIASYDHALALDPDAKFLAGACHHARMQICDWSRFDADLVRLSAGVESGRRVISPFISLSVFDSPALQRKASEIWANGECSPRVPLAPPTPHPPHDRIRLGYFSADFRNHAVSALIAELFECHDRSRFELTAFALGPDVQDELRARLEPAFDRFLPVAARSDFEVAVLARQLGIDIAIDLGGYTQDARPRILALRAAPVQVSYLGYLGTMGARFIDYLIADPTLVPEESRNHYAERIAYLPSYQVNDSRRPMPDRTFARAELGLPPTGFVFCCFNASYKITPGVFTSWMNILAAVPGSVLFLLGGNAALERNLRQAAARHRIVPDRLVFGRRVAFGDYLARYGSADLFLDTSPYNAGTTASDALWAGLPVLTCPGEAFASRMATSILTAARLPELITADRGDYERRAIELATSPDRLAHIKQRLANARATAPLFDTRAFTRNLEALYQRMHHRNLAGSPPAHLLPDGGATTSAMAPAGLQARP
jgi:predicted O-linked N-acetylglucosamine transferase (SPINDLY family)